MSLNVHAQLLVYYRLDKNSKWAELFNIASHSLTPVSPKLARRFPARWTSVSRWRTPRRVRRRSLESNQPCNQWTSHSTSWATAGPVQFYSPVWLPCAWMIFFSSGEAVLHSADHLVCRACGSCLRRLSERSVCLSSATTLPSKEPYLVKISGCGEVSKFLCFWLATTHLDPPWNVLRDRQRQRSVVKLSVFWSCLFSLGVSSLAPSLLPLYYSSLQLILGWPASLYECPTASILWFE